MIDDLMPCTCHVLMRQQRAQMQLKRRAAFPADRQVPLAGPRALRLNPRLENRCRVPKRFHPVANDDAAIAASIQRDHKAHVSQTHIKILGLTGQPANLSQDGTAHKDRVAHFTMSSAWLAAVDLGIERAICSQAGHLMNRLFPSLGEQFAPQYVSRNIAASALVSQSGFATMRYGS